MTHLLTLISRLRGFIKNVSGYVVHACICPGASYGEASWKYVSYMGFASGPDDHEMLWISPLVYL